MSDRLELARDFVGATDWAGAKVAPLAGDASNRTYRRLTRGAGDTAVLMDAPPERGEDVRPFVRIARFLCDQGLSAPQILAADEDRGFLLLEDLGDDLYARVLDRDPGRETALYAVATDALADLHRVAPLDGVPTYSLNVMPDLAALTYDWYISYLGGNPDAKREVFLAEMSRLIAAHAADVDVLVQRDYHAENLLWLPGRDGVARVGLLDFQDGARGHRAYDLVSVLQDARRDVSPDVEAAMIDRYVTATGVDRDAFVTAYHVLGAQRNLRIIGLFVRLGMRNAKVHYLDLIPRVHGLLLRDLAHPALTRLREIVLPVLPDPTPANLTRLRALCQTVPAP